MTPKQQRFVEEYLIDLNATQAAIRAGYSETTAHVIGQENLRKPVIREAVDDALKRRSEKTQIDAEWVLKKAAALFEKCEREGETFNPSAAVAALNLVAKHQSVNALAEKTIDAKLNGELKIRWENAGNSDSV